ncbi:hypothetical protein KFE25_008633 [Diacronema lutheri]|uniref:Uncharacterized protein n=1 Tax=Diacronema lutheri TaxID=2081491 RepID=A0A8J6CCT4_DIALT|nr:hypothetical protein KFE25_008633 [Diacronema lutheri]
MAAAALAPRGGRLLRSVAARAPPQTPFSTPRLIRPERHLDAFLRRADRAQPVRASPGPSARTPPASHVFAREYALLQRVFLELDDRLGDTFAPTSLLVADLPGSQAAALLAAHDKWGDATGSLVRLACPRHDALAAFRELCPERAVELMPEDGGVNGSPVGARRRFDLICASFDAHHAAAGRGGVGAAATSRLAETVVAMSRLLSPGGVLVLVEPLGAEHIGELYLEPTLVPAVRQLAAERIAQGARLAVVAPCMHSRPCPLLARPRAFNATRTRHCTFAQRYERRRTQLLGELRASLNFGNTHFAYLCLTAPHPESFRASAGAALGEGEAAADGGGSGGAAAQLSGRILTPPRKRSGHVMLDLCTADGELRTVTVTRRKHGGGGGNGGGGGGGEGGEALDGADEEGGRGGDDGAPRSPYRAARVSAWGDPWVGPRDE